jgi:hypothetical protein
MNVAVPWLKHSPKLGHCASSQTVASPDSRSSRLMRATPGPVGALARIQAGLRGIWVVGCTLTGIRETLSWPRWWVSGVRRDGALSGFGSFMVGFGSDWVG